MLKFVVSNKKAFFLLLLFKVEIDVQHFQSFRPKGGFEFDVTYATRNHQLFFAAIGKVFAVQIQFDGRRRG